MCLIINIETIEHSQHRYETVGDWNYTAIGDWRIRVSEMNNWRYEFLVAFHEMIEQALCRHRGVSEKEVTVFDKDYEERRKEGDDSEPGDDPNAPYFFQHQIATLFERVMARLLNVNWQEYEQAIYSL